MPTELVRRLVARRVPSPDCFYLGAYQHIPDLHNRLIATNIPIDILNVQLSEVAGGPLMQQSPYYLKSAPE
jgi:hypothetical protein